MNGKTSFNDIGISAELDWRRIRKLLIIGIYAAIMVPGTVLFFLFFIVACYGQIAAFSKGLTPYPKWCWVFSMPLPMLLVQMLHKIIGNVAWAHAIATGWISVGNLWMFGGLLFVMQRVQKNKEVG